ncbi:MAG: 50S ribosomal protein L13 [bacterium]|nr:50S ribosomal protein L13 [bacterium]MCY3925997.1 50S ribosomal protein L13 [bacterium]
MRTYSPPASEVDRAWWIVDAEGQVLGRMATEVARILAGKHKPIYAPHLDCGDHVIIVNAERVAVTADKSERKILYRHSGYPGGLRSETLGAALGRQPAEVVRRSIRGMLPKTRLGRRMLRKLKVYAGPVHPHEAQKPQPLPLGGRTP